MSRDVGPAGGFDADLLVAGGSTAGLSTAIYAAYSGMRVIVFEPREAPLEKACGEGLMPAAVSQLKEMGIDCSEFHPLAGIKYISGKSTALGCFRNGTGAGIRRNRLQYLMLQRARQLGIRFIKGKIKNFHDHGTHVSAEGLTGRWLAGCDGLRSTVRKGLNIPNRRSRPLRFGLRQHFEVYERLSFVEVYWLEDFEVYVTPVDDKVVNVAVLFEEGRPYPDFLSQVSGLQGRLGRPVSKVLGAGPFEQHPDCPIRGNIFLVGDAAGFLDPITGEGNQLAMAAARILVSCLQRGTPESYYPEYKAAIRNYWYITALLLQLARGRQTRPLIVPALKQIPGLFDLALSLLSGRKNYISDSEYIPRILENQRGLRSL